MIATLPADPRGRPVMLATPIPDADFEHRTESTTRGNGTVHGFRGSPLQLLSGILCLELALYRGEFVCLVVTGTHHGLTLGQRPSELGTSGRTA